jgi:hypothetical protein
MTIFLLGGCLRRDPRLSADDSRTYWLRRFTASQDHVVVEEHVARTVRSAAA